MKKQFAVAIIAILLLFVLTVTLTCLSPIVSATPWTPVEWQDGGKLKNWVQDQNGNFVDDHIEAQTGKVDIIVDLNGCIGDPAKSEIVNYLNTLGDVEYVGKYVSFVIVKGVEVNRTADIARQPEVAMVELATTDKWLGDNFRASRVETSATYHPNTLQDAFGWPGALNGHDINIAFLDTGANPTYDPYVTHGYDAINNVETNPGPDPTVDHASWMASWVFGPGGIAPQAGLVDMKVGDASGADSAAVMRALEKVYEKQRDWGINVVVMMFSGDARLDGREARQQLIDLLSGQGIVVVAGTGSNANDAPVTGPGAATRAIGVSTANITDTVDRADDVAPYVQGPRMSDDDMDQLDELKPEVIMPTGESGTMVSNSIATAMTSGLVALILQHNADLRNFDNKASGSVKDLLIRSAEPKGTADTTVEYPRSTPTWDQYWGFGEIDTFEAFRYLSAQVETGRTDLTFMGFDGTSHPSSPWYYSHAVETQSERDGRNIEAGVPDRIFARVYNNGPQNAHNVRVSFGFYPWTAGIPKFYDIGSVVTDIERFRDKNVSIDWTPPTLPAGEAHGCILVTINYGLDSDFSNGSNFAQKNIRVLPASSPAVFAFRVENPLPTKARIELKVRTEHKEWTIKLSETSFTMEPYECARTVQATVEPSARVKPGTEALFFVTAYATAMGQEKGLEIGGVALKAYFKEEKPTKLDIYFADARESPGSVYHYNTTTEIEETVYTRPSRRLYSFSFHPVIPQKLYFVNANENKIYRTHQLPSGWTPEEVIYTHTTYVRDIAFAFGKDGELRFYFSEATGAGGNGKIYKIEDGKASLYYEVKLADVGGFWAGDFAFDDKGNLYLSSGNRVPASIYKVEGGRVKEIFKDVKECISGLVYADGALYYANWGTKIYRLDLSTKERTAVYSNTKRIWLSDVDFRPELIG